MKSKLGIKNIILLFMVAVYPLIVIPVPLDSFRGPRYVFLAIVSLLSLYFLFRDRINVKQPVFIPLAIFLSFFMISTLLADDILMAWVGNYLRFTGFSTYLFCVILFVLASQHKNPGQILMPMILGAVFVSLFGLMQFYGLNLIPHDFFPEGSRVAYSTLGHPNWFGTYVVLILPASILFYLNEKKVLWLATTAFIYGGLLVSLTRGVWLSFLVSFVIICVIWLKNRETKKQFLMLIIVLAGATLILLPANEWSIISRVYTIPDAVTTTVGIADDAVQGIDSVYERYYIWEEAAIILSENWAFGIGADNLRIKMPSGRIEDKAHNIYLEIAVTMGIFSLISYLVFLSFFLRVKKNETGFILFIMVFTYLVQGFSNNDMVQIMPIFWIVLGLSLANGKE